MRPATGLVVGRGDHAVDRPVLDVGRVLGVAVHGFRLAPVYFQVFVFLVIHHHHPAGAWRCGSGCGVRDYF